MTKPTSTLIPKRVQIIEEEKKLKGKKKIATTFLEISPYKQIMSLEKYKRKDDTVILLENEVYLQIYKYKSYDLNLLNGEEKSFLIAQYTNFLRMYQNPIKNISLMFPVNTSKQQRYWEMKYRTAKNDIQSYLASTELRRLKAIENIYKTQSHYLLIYSNTLKDIVDKMQTVERFSMLFEKKPLSLEDKEQLLYRINNQDNE